MKKKVLFIKPFQVELSETENMISSFKQRFPGSKCALLANVYRSDYKKLSSNVNIDKKFLYTPDTKSLDISEFLKLIIEFHKEKFDLAVALIGEPDFSAYQGYKKAKLLASFSGAKRILAYSTKEDIETLFLNSKKTRGAPILKTLIMQRIDAIKYIFSTVMRTILLYSIAGFFLIFMLTGIKLRRLLFRVKNSLLRN